MKKKKKMKLFIPVLMILNLLFVRGNIFPVNTEKVLKPVIKSESKIIISGKNGDVFYKIPYSKPLEFNFKGPGILKVKTASGKKNSDNKIYRISYIIDGREDKKLKELMFPKKRSFSIKLGIGHHTLKFFSLEKEDKIYGNFRLLPKKEKNREWKKINPISRYKLIRLDIKENIVKYFRLDREKHIRLKVEGPVKIRFFTRLEKSANGNKVEKYSVTVKNKGSIKYIYNLKTTVSKIAHYRNKRNNNKVIWKSRNISFNVPAGTHKYDFFVSGDNPSTFLGRFIYSPYKSKSGLRAYSNKKNIISEISEAKEPLKVNWKLFFINSGNPEKVALKIRNRTRLYYRLRKGKTLRFKVSGPGKIKIITRIENNYRMRGRINYRVKIKTGKLRSNTFRFSSLPSETVEYKRERDKIPGRSKEIVLKSPRGLNIYEISNLEKDKNILLRILSEKKQDEIFENSIKKRKWIPADLGSVSEYVFVNIKGKTYKYYSTGTDRSIRLKIQGPLELKIIIRAITKAGIGGENPSGFKIVTGGTEKKYTFNKNMISSAKIQGMKSLRVSEGKTIGITIPAGSNDLDILPLHENGSGIYFRLFKRKGALFTKVIKYVEENAGKNNKQDIVLAKVKKRNSKTFGKKETKNLKKKNKRKGVEFRISTRTLYDSNILRYSQLYKDRFSNPLPKDEGRYNVNSIDDLVIKTSLRVKYPFKIFGNLISTILADISFSGYTTSKIKNWVNTSFLFRQQLSKKNSMQISMGIIPDYYIRTYRDLDLVDNLGYVPDTFQSLNFSSRNFSVRYDHKIFKDMKIRIAASFRNYTFNQEFSEYDSSDYIAGIRVYKNLTKKIRFNIGYRYRTSDAKGYDGTGETKLTSDDYDASYKQKDFIFGFMFKLPEFFNAKQDLYFGHHIYKREYSTLASAIRDPYHAGRLDDYVRIFLNYSIRPSNRFAISLFYNLNKRDSFRNFLYDKVDLTTEKSYSQHIFGISFTYTFRSKKTQR